ncbi:MAG: hypothetical protein V1778_01150 [bacterium]
MSNLLFWHMCQFYALEDGHRGSHSQKAPNQRNLVAITTIIF